MYNPGSVVVKSGGSTVDGFYSSANSTITITPTNTSELGKYGFYLKGVYFAANNLSASSMYESRTGKYRTDKVYYVEAKDNAVSVTLNQSFVKTLIDKGVVSSQSLESETIKIYPVFARETVLVCFENADRDDSKAETRGKYDETYLCSHFSNIIEAYI